jgi:hypothetical protein
MKRKERRKNKNRKNRRGGRRREKEDEEEEEEQEEEEMKYVVLTPKYLHMVRTNMQGHLKLLFCLPYSCCNTSFCNPSPTFYGY